jgi:uncharacterized membrane protein YozB (DUF420 family)
MTATVAPALRRTSIGSYDRVFYSTMSFAMAATVFTGFASTYYLPLIGDGPTATVSGGPFTSIVHLHGALFTAWVGLFLIQTTLVATRRVSVHRKLGVVGAVLAMCMIAAGVSVAIATAARGGAPPGVDPRAFLIIPLTDMLLFATFVITALVRRRDKEAHKRLMLLAYTSIMAAAMARLPGVLPLGPFVFFGLAFVFVVAGATYDLATRRRIHRVYLWGGALFAASVPLRLMLSSTAVWQAFASWIVSR